MLSVTEDPLEVRIKGFLSELWGTELGQITIRGRQVYFCSLNEDLPEYPSSFFLSLSVCVKLGLPHKFHQGPHVNYHYKSLCALGLV